MKPTPRKCLDRHSNRDAGGEFGTVKTHEYRPKGRVSLPLREFSLELPVVSTDSKEGMPTPGDSLAGERLHICVGHTCNNNCVFCMEEDRQDRFDRLSGQTDGDVQRMMQVPGAREVMFTSGEPTMHERLPDYVAMARDMGFEIVGLITNGRRLSYLPYTRSLLEAGLSHVLVSIHGPTARVHDALTRTRGAFAQAIKGLACLASLKGEFPTLKVHTSYVVNRRNFQLFGDFFDAMRPFGVDQHVFNVMMPEGRGGKLSEQLMPRYSDIAVEFRRFLDGLTPEEASRVFLLDIPYCTTTRLPDAVRGYVERYFHFEPDGTVLFGDSSAEPTSDGDLYEKSALAGDNATYSKVTKSAHDEAVRSKRPQCHDCGFDRFCRGVFNRYVDQYGWDEFVPVTEGKNHAR